MISLSRSKDANQDAGVPTVGVAACAMMIGMVPAHSEVHISAPGSQLRVQYSDAATVADTAPKAPDLEMTMPAVEREILNLRRHEGWDGEGARPITKNTCRKAVEFVKLVAQRVPHAPRPFVGASRTGAVALRWMRGRHGIMLSVTAGAQDRAAYMVGGGGVRAERGEDDWPRVVERLREFLVTD